MQRWWPYKKAMQDKAGKQNSENSVLCEENGRGLKIADIQIYQTVDSAYARKGK